MAPGRLSLLYVGSLPPARHGVAVVGGQLLATFAGAGHRVRAISPVEGPPEPDRLADASPGVEVIPLRMPHVPSDHARAPEEYRRELGARLRGLVGAQVAVERPDVILVGNTSMAEHLPGLTGPHRIPTVVMLHGITTAGMLDNTLPAALRQRLLDGFREASVLVAVAPHVASAVHPLGLANVRVIENPVDVRRFAPRPKERELMGRLGIAPEDLVMAHASKLEPVKRPLDLVPAVERLLRAEPRLLCLVLGDGSLRAPMEQAIAERGIGHRFRFVGWITHSAVPAHLNLADVVVMPSELEGRSLVYLETWASGGVLVASDIPAARELIVDGDTGLLFRTGDVAHLVERTLQALADPRLRQAIGRQARRAAEGHALEDVGAAYVGLFREVVARRPA